MRITTEASLRRIVRRIISEAAGTEEKVNVTNSTKTKITVDFVCRKKDLPNAKNLIKDPVEIEAGASADVAFTPTTDDTEFAVYATRFQGTGVTKGYSRDTLFDFFNSGVAVTFGSLTDSDDSSDSEPMEEGGIEALLQPGEKYEIINDPTDPEFQYAVVYKLMPTRAIVVSAPEADRKGGKIVSSKGQEISPRRYGGSFKKIADAFIEKMKTPA